MPRNARATLRLVDLTGDPPGEVMLFRAGTNKSYKGELIFDDAAAAMVLADAKDHGAEYFFDYDHASLYPIGKDAGEAAAWFTLEVREGALWAVKIRWTEEATAKVTARKYRYISPAVEYDVDSRRIWRLINVALTNLPASHGLPPLMAASQNQMEETMLEGALAHIAEALGLDPEKATEDELIAAFDEKIEGDGPPSSEKGETGEALAQLRTLTGKKSDKEALAAAVAELSAARSADADREINDLVEKGIATRRIPAENREAYVRLGKKDLEALRDLVGTAAPPPKNDKPAGKTPAKKPSPPLARHEQATLSARSPRVSEHDLSVARTLGLDPATLAAIDD